MDAQRQVALADRNPADPHILPHDNGPRRLIHDDTRFGFRFDQQVFDTTKCMCGGRHPRSNNINVDCSRIQHTRHTAIEITVDDCFDPRSRREIRRPQSKPQRRKTREIEIDLALHRRARGDDTRRWNALRHARPLTLYRDAACYDGALRHGIDFAISCIQRGHDQGAAKQAARIADGRDSDVNRASGPGERRQACSYNYGSHVLWPKLFAGHIDAQPFQNIGHDFFSERRVA